MREQINEQELESVVGGIVRVSGNRMKVSFSTLQEAYKLVNCDASDAALLAQILYNEHKNEGDLAYENAVKAAFQERGWINI